MKKRNGSAILEALLAPASFGCLACGRRGDPSPVLPGICRKCAAEVPWIERPRCRKCGRPSGCPDCARGSARLSAWICNRSAVAYSDAMRDWLGRYKYRGDQRFAEPLGRMLEQAYLRLAEERGRLERNAAIRGEAAVDAGVLPRAFAWLQGALGAAHPAGPRAGRSWQADLLVPVPVSAVRLGERGFNQAEELACLLAGRQGLEVLPLLARSRHTGKQSFKGRAERIADMKRVFVPDPEAPEMLRRWLAPGPVREGRALRVVVVDDIYTTGATVTACCEALAELLASCGMNMQLYSLTWARS
ncbi:double zinc ribbon domain-containing protein [Paenibacillus glufosinatiresistens]|uniref:double zinc ribbon domain-containing protein n=1 Tax=Paenibacillus glufosinatiresistens TaxID=3070657 RepID=UPI00286E15EB|nr:double zinc ribbon domain-containing protein [Paenibacillus sp. YX.27]